MRPKTCVVTGSSRGIGRGIAERFGADGCEVVVNYRSSEAAAAEAVDRIEAAGGSAIAVQADVTDVEDIERMRERAHDAFGRVDVLVNNAGITQDVRFTQMSHWEWDVVLDVHLDGAFHCTRAFYDDLAAAEEGRLVNISGLIGKGSNFGQANYATANCVAPEFVSTRAVERLPEEIKDRLRADTPLDRLGEIEEIAEVVTFLASDRSSFITGEVIDVNGGKDL